jgi:hypothetical protein
MRCLRCGCWLLVGALIVHSVGGSMERDPCAWVCDCTASVEPIMSPSLHIPDDSDRTVEIQDHKVSRSERAIWPKPINIRVSDAFEFSDEVLIALG